MLKIYILPLSLACLLFTFASGQTTHAQATAFSDGLDAIRVLMKKGNWKKSLERLDALLEAHRKRKYVRAFRTEIEFLHRRCTFRAAMNQPDLKTLVSGDILQFKVATGKMRMRYTPATLEGDFRKTEKGSWYYTPSFTGPYTLTFKGSGYPRLAPCVFLEFSDIPQFYFLRFTYCKEEGEVDLVFCDEGSNAIRRSRKKIPPALCKPRYLLRIKVGAKSISVNVNGHRIASLAKPKTRDGILYFKRFYTFTELLLCGSVQTSWMQGKIDAVIQKKLKTFEKKYLPRDHLPPWLYSPPEETGEKPGFKVFPGPYSAVRWRLYSMLYEEIVHRSPEWGLEQLQEKTDRDVHPLARAYLTALYHRRLEDYPKAVATLDTVLEAQPDFEVGNLVKADLLCVLGEGRKAIDVLQELISVSPEYPYSYSRLFYLLFEEGRIKEARLTLARACSLRVPPTGLEKLQALVVKAMYGPDWARTYEYKTSHYHIMSDIDQKTCYDAARVLEDTYRGYRVHLKWLRRAEGGRFKVLIFSGREGYMKYTRDVMGVSPAKSTGLYSNRLKQLLIWNTPDRKEMMRTVRHEGFHQYIRRIMDNPPLWLNEGMAEYYERAEFRNGRWLVGMMRPDHLKELGGDGGKMIPLEKLITLKRETFYGKHSHRNYAQAWAFVQFLRHSTKPNRKLFDRLFKALQETSDIRAVQAAVFKGLLPDLETQFRSYVISR